MSSDPIENNPYLQSRALWLDIYGSAEERYKKARKLNVQLILLVGLCIAGLIYNSLQSKFVPYVVQVQEGHVIYANVATESHFDSLKPALALFFIQNFILSSRTVSVDIYMQKNNQKKAYALTQGTATMVLRDFYQVHDPYIQANKQTVTVKLHYVNRLPQHAFRVGWTEISRDSQTGQMLSQKNYIGEFHFAWDKPSQDEFILQNNPLGFYVTTIAWTGVK